MNLNPYFIQEALRKLLILENCAPTDKDYQAICQGRPVEVAQHELNREVWFLSRRKRAA